MSKRKQSDEGEVGKKKKIHRTFSREAAHIKDTYEFLEQLGSGSFSIVHEAKHKATGKRFAIKVIKRAVFERNKQNTEQEITVLSKLEHTHIVSLNEVVRTRDELCIVMELCRGGELFDRIVSRERYTENDAKEVVKTVLGAVRYLHKNQIVHRDLKPENLIFASKEEDAVLKLTDFGLATYFAPGTKLHAFCGTPEYVAPEILNKDQYDSQVDMWSLGVIVYILLCGFPPFFGESNPELFKQIQSGSYDFPSPYFDVVSPEAKDFITKLLTVDSTKRYNVDQAFDHPWLTATQESRELGVAKQLARYNAIRRFRRGVLAVVAAKRIKNLESVIGKSLAENERVSGKDKEVDQHKKVEVKEKSGAGK